VRRGGHTAPGLVAALVVLAADQASKWWVVNELLLPERRTFAIPHLPVLNLTWVENRGITFGLFSGDSAVGSAVLTVAALAVVAALAAWLYRAESRLVAVALGGIAGGAVGNVIDRIRFGWVIDFIHAHTPAFGWSWYVFNVADAAIVCGVATLVLDGLRGRHGKRLAPDPPGG
jgi:lipoprotein signal peptidase